MTRNNNKTEFTTDNLRAKAAIFRVWATEIESLARQLEDHGIHSVELRFESNLAIGLDKVLSWVYDAKKSVSSMMFHGELETHFVLNETGTEYQSKPPKTAPPIDTEEAQRKPELHRKAAAFAKPKAGPDRKAAPRKNSG